MTRPRLLALAVSSVLSLALGWGLLTWWRERPPSPGLIFRAGDTTSVATERAASRAARGLAGGSRSGSAARTPEEYEYYLTEEHAERAFGLGGPKDNRIYDAWCGYRVRPGRNARMVWNEHPDGHYYSVTNSDGLPDREFDPEAPTDLRVLAAGDSHTFGLCGLEDNWTRQLELMLGQDWPDDSIEVLNTGQGGYTFYNYLGALHKYLEWRPEVFIVAAFGGNDFSEQLAMAYLFGESGHFGLTPREKEKRAQADEISPYAIGQTYSSLYRFASHPDKVEPAIECTLGVLARIQTICEQNDILFVLAVIPPPGCLDWSDRPPAFDQVADCLELPPDACELGDEMIARLLAGARELGATVIDLRTPFEQLEDPPYWRFDFHLSVEGHRLVAEQVHPAVAEWVRERGAR